MDELKGCGGCIFPVGGPAIYAIRGFPAIGQSKAATFTRRQLNAIYRHNEVYESQGEGLQLRRTIQLCEGDIAELNSEAGKTKKPPRGTLNRSERMGTLIG